MRVHDSSSSASAQAAAAKATAIPAAEQTGESQRSEQNVAKSDHIQLSNPVQRILDVEATTSTERAERLARLTAEVRSGNYHPDPLEISKGMIEEALSDTEL